MSRNVFPSQEAPLWYFTEVIELTNEEDHYIHFIINDRVHGLSVSQTSS